MLNRDFGIPGHVATDLEALAWIARVRGDHFRAARLLGASDALHATLGKPIQAEMRRERDADLALVLAALGDERFAVAWGEGKAMTMSTAITYALEGSASI